MVFISRDESLNRYLIIASAIDTVNASVAWLLGTPEIGSDSVSGVPVEPEMMVQRFFPRKKGMS